MAESEGQIERSNRCAKFLRSSKFKVYCSYALSCIGDRAWSFALSLALYEVGQSLRLPAIANLVRSLSVLIFGSVVGSWIDGANRLRAARVSLVVNNVSVVFSASALMALVHTHSGLPVWLRNLLIGASISLCAISVLAGVGTKIVVAKDWVAVMCRGKSNELADMNAWMVRIDQTALILSPLLAGQIMASISVSAGCLFVAAWNVLSFALEYYLLWAVYRQTPRLAAKTSSSDENEGKEMIEVSKTDETSRMSDKSTVDQALNHSHPSKLPLVEEVEPKAPENSTRRSGASFVDKFTGWGTYFSQSVLPAGLALAFLYFTVMGFDGITSSFIVSQGVPPNLLAVAGGLGAISGIIGSFAFPQFKKMVGLVRTGLFALSAEILALSISVSSVWLPGSPFDPFASFNATSVPPERDFPVNSTGNYPDQLLQSDSDVTDSLPSSYASISAFVVGIVLARFGLWMSDLTITQIIQEGCGEQIRGRVFGVQSSLNQLLSLLKDLLVIAFPLPRTFGILILSSFASICAGFFSYCVYSRKMRGHILPFHNQIKCHSAG